MIAFLNLWAICLAAIARVDLVLWSCVASQKCGLPFRKVFWRPFAKCRAHVGKIALVRQRTYCLELSAGRRWFWRLQGRIRNVRLCCRLQGGNVAVALDLSASMGETDMSLGDVTRIELIRDVLGEFMLGRRGDRISLIGFGTEAYIISPLTFDVASVTDMLDEVTIGLPGRRTDLGQAIGLSVQMMRNEPEGERLLILISDGETNVGALAARDAAQLAAKVGLKVLCHWLRPRSGRW